MISALSSHKSWCAARVFSTEGLLANFGFMSCCLSLNHGCLIACFPLAIPSLGFFMGNITLGMFYLANTVAVSRTLSSKLRSVAARHKIC